MRRDHPPLNFDALSTHQMLILLLISQKEKRTKCNKMIQKMNVNFFLNSLKSFFGLAMISLGNVLGQSLYTWQSMLISTYVINFNFP
jgi:hypothetical protein